ncbi:MAG TPA: rhomboid family intramembrane serine protease [Flavitalea sp.]|nr:rhomboid family intramembrane serine protease [Flavitalea sp.]
MNPSPVRMATGDPLHSHISEPRFSEENDWYADRQYSFFSGQRTYWKSVFPSRTYVITPLIIYVNIFLYIFLETGVLSQRMPPNEGWKFLFSTFMHAGIIQLLVNMYGLMVIGRELESVIGSMRFLGIFIFSAWLAFFNTILWNDQTVSSGTAGGIFGLYGCYFGLLISKYISGSNCESVYRTMIVLVAYHLSMGFLGNFDNAAHLGGLLYGALMGVLGGKFLLQKNIYINKIGA